MRVAVIEYPGIRRACYEQLISAALQLAHQPCMQQMARWDWGRFSQWILSHPFEVDSGHADKKVSATACTPRQRMRIFPQTMNCWERVLHQLAWFAARGAERTTLYDHDTLVGRHIEVLVPPTTYLGTSATLPARTVANGASEQALAGVLGGLQGGLSGAGMGASAGPYGALAGFILGAGLGAAKGALSPEASTPPSLPPVPATVAPVVQAAPVPPGAVPVATPPVPKKTESPPAVSPSAARGKTRPSFRKADKRNKKRRTSK